jgi:hypothetical protein
LSSDPYRAPLRAQQADAVAQQRRFARAVRPHDRNHLALAHRQRNAAQHRRPIAVGEMNIDEVEHRVAGRRAPPGRPVVRPGWHRQRLNAAKPGERDLGRQFDLVGIGQRHEVGTRPQEHLTALAQEQRPARLSHQRVLHAMLDQQQHMAYSGKLTKQCQRLPRRSRIQARERLVEQQDARVH